MIKIFRQLRANLLGKGQISGYLLYALGEIVLVMIGILLALQINNANELRKNERIVDSILKQIHSELAVDIGRTTDIIAYYHRKDSLIHLILSEELSAADYQIENHYPLTTVAVTINVLNIQTEGFQNLMNASERLSTRYDSILLDLKDLYIDDKAIVDLNMEYLKKNIEGYLNWLKLNTSWFSEVYFTDRPLSEERIAFYLRNPTYRNVLTEQHFIGVTNHCMSVIQFRQSAIAVYEKLGAFLQLETPPPYATTDYADYPGTFHDDSDTLRISLLNDKLILEAYEEGQIDTMEIVPLTDRKFAAENGGFCYLRSDSTQRVTGLTIRQGSVNFDLKKMD